jgi:hypothetical protein
VVYLKAKSLYQHGVSQTLSPTLIRPEFKDFSKFIMEHSDQKKFHATLTQNKLKTEQKKESNAA